MRDPRLAAGIVLAILGAPAQDGGTPATPAEPDAPEAPEEEEVEVEPLELRVNDAVDRACEFVLKHQEEAGGFRTDDKVHPLGRTALSLLALLHGGVSTSEPPVARAIDFLLARLDANAGSQTGGAPAYRSTYETGIALMLLFDLGPNERFAGRMEPLARFLIERFDRGPKLWGYPEGARDLSNSQYAILGLRAAARRGIRPPGYKEALAGALEGVLTCQRGNGGFGYQPDKFATGSMTVAALAMIRFLDQELDRFPAAQKHLALAKKAAKRGEAWLSANFSVEYNPEGLARGMGFWPYYMYGLERYAAFYDLKRVAERDWYREGAEALLGAQKDDGSWGSLEDTCFAILFLEKSSLSGPATREHSPTAASAKEKLKPKPDPTLPCLREWLVCGPFQETSDDDALIVDHVGEARVKPAHNKAASKSARWTRHVSSEDRVDMVKAVAPNGGLDVDRCAIYAATWLDVAEDVEAQLWIDCDDGIRVFQDGALALEDHHHDGKEDILAPLALTKGRHLLLFKLENVGYGCWFKARFAGPDGGPATAIVATTR